MKGPINILVRSVALSGLVAALTACSLGQAINIDLDVGSGDPEQGNGAPSSTFGAAAGQPGFWNRVQFGASPVQLVNTAGQPTTAVMTLESSGSISGTGFRNESNTGDYALLLNDAMQIGVLSHGGNKTFTFNGLVPGNYLVYTYAVAPSGYVMETPVFVSQAVQNHIQIVTGPMPGNSFEYLVTHSIHEALVDSEGFSIFINQPPMSSNGMHINGIQIAPVPEPLSFISVPLFCSLLLLRKRRSH